MKKKNWNKIIHETYELLFKASEPPADFNELLNNAVINEDGKKDIGFMNYEIDEDIMSDIMLKQSDKYKMSKLEQRSFSISIYLGCSPKSKYKKLTPKAYSPNNLKNI